jgi:dsDNA-specific endonuclease/ATPase MutS2
MQIENFKLSKKDKELWNYYIENYIDNNNFDIKEYANSTFLSKKLDLHGLTINDAWIEFNNFICDHYNNKTKTVTIITGKSGKIANEFIDWCENNQYIKSYLPMGKDYNNPGSYKITLNNK